MDPKAEDKWIHNFSLSETQKHDRGFTIYKITSIIFPVYKPEALSCITVWKRYSDVKRLHKQLEKRIREDPRLLGRVSLPKLAGDRKLYFRRFDQAVVEQRRLFIIELLEYVSLYPLLYSSQNFVAFLQGGHTPNSSPRKHSGGEPHDHYIDPICDELDIPIQSNGAFIDPNREERQFREFDSLSEEQTSNSISEDAVSLSIGPSQPLVNDIQPKPTTLTKENSDQIDSVLKSDYVVDAAEKFNEALQLEVNDRFEQAFEVYKQGIDILLAGVKSDGDEMRRKLAKQNVAKYLTRAENLQESYIIPRLKMQQSSQSPTLELPLNHLAKYKVVKILDDNVMSVQEVTTRKFYVIKSIDKPDKTDLGLEVLLVQTLVPHMVSLVAYFQTEFAVFLLLQPASGGKLIDYISSYVPVTEVHPEELLDDKTTIVVEDIPENVKISTSSESCSDHSLISGTGYDSGYVEFGQMADEMDNLPSLENLTKDIDVLELLTSSQNLLKSVQNTLDYSKTAKAVEPLDSQDKEVSLQNTKDCENTLESTRTQYQIPEGCIKQWARELVIAIDALHAQNIILGDLTIDNVLLGSNGQVLLTYFYSRFQPRSLFSFNRVALKGWYVAPERPISEKSDWWSFGVVLYELLTGTRFIETHAGGFFYYHEIQFPECSDVELSFEAVSLLNGLIEKNPSNRYGIDDICTHAFFENTDWIELRKKGLNY